MLCPAQLRMPAAVTAALTAGAWRLLSFLCGWLLPASTICGRLEVYTRCDKISCFGQAFIRSGLLLLCFCLLLSALTLRLASLAQGKVQLVQVWHVQLASLPAFLGSSAARRPDANGNSISFIRRKNCNDTCTASAGHTHSTKSKSNTQAMHVLQNHGTLTLLQRLYVKQ